MKINKIRILQNHNQNILNHSIEVFLYILIYQAR